MLKKDQAKISVVVPVYNVTAYLEECVDSILSQTHQNLEVILVDDGSTDGSAASCDRYAASDSRVKVIHKTNGGLSSARNAGIDVATGEYIGFVDSDDVIAPDMYQSLLENMTTYGAGISVCSKTDKQEDLQKGNGSPEALTCEQALKKMIIGIEFGSHACDKLYKTTLFGTDIRYPVGKTYEDLFTTYKLIDCAGGVVFADANKYYYRPNPGSITQSKYSSANLNLIYGINEVGQFFAEKYPRLEKFRRMALVRSSAYILRRMIVSGSYDAGPAKEMQKNIRKNIFVYYLSPYKLSGKLFATAAMVSFSAARTLYGLLAKDE